MSADSELYDVLPLLRDFDAIGMRNKHICGLLPTVTETAMSRAKTGIEPLDPQDFLDVKHLLSECQELARRNPLPVNWTDLRKVRQQLDTLRGEKNDPLSVREADILRDFARGEPVESLSAAAGQSVEDFLTMIGDMLRRAGRLSQSVK